MNVNILKRRNATFGATLVVISAFSYGTVPVLAKLTFARGVSLAQFLSWRFAIAACLLWIVVLVTGRHLPARNRVIPFVLLGAVGYVGQSAAFFLALQRIPAATTALLLYTYPAIVTIAAAALLRETLTARKSVAIAIAFGGTSLVVQGTMSGISPVGVAFALLSALIYSAYILFGSKVFAGQPPIAAAATVMSSTAAAYVTYSALAGQLSLPAYPAQLGMIAAVAVIGTAVPVLAFIVGMPRVGPSRASILSTFEPAVTVLLATLVLGEPFRPIQIVGACCVIASVVVLEAGGSFEPAQL
jgi:drug/metabolite transporter (DMT)-like permease